MKRESVVGGLDTIPSTKPSSKRYKSQQQKVEKACKDCGKTTFVPISIIRSTQDNPAWDGYLCYNCRKKSKKEVQDAILAMALRKYRAKK